jgi:hypothetical protein
VLAGSNLLLHERIRLGVQADVGTRFVLIIVRPDEFVEHAEKLQHKVFVAELERFHRFAAHHLL